MEFPGGTAQCLTHKLLQTLVLQLRLKTFFCRTWKRIHRSTCKITVRNAHRQTLITLAMFQFQCPQPEDMDIAHTSHQPRVSPVPSSPSLLPHSWLKWHFEFRFHCSATKVFFVTFRQIAPTAQMSAFVILEQLFSNLSGLVLSSTATPAVVVLAVLTWELTDLQNFVSLSETV